MRRSHDPVRGQRTRAVLVAVLFSFGVGSAIIGCARAWSRGLEDPRQTAFLAYVERFRTARAHLPGAGARIGYVQQGAALALLPEGSEYLDPFMARFALAPSVPVSREPGLSLLLVNFRDAERARAFARAEGLAIEFDAGNGVALLRSKGR